MRGVVAVAVLALAACGPSGSGGKGRGPADSAPDTDLVGTGTGVATGTGTGALSDTGAACPPGPFTAWEDPVVCALRAEIDGTRIREGTLRWLDEEACKELIRVDGTCYGNHPASPYGMFDFPEDEHGDALASYQIAQDEAVIYVGHTPPQSRYFGFTNYQYDTVIAGRRVDTFGSIGPTLNHKTLRIASAPTAPFEAYTVVVFTPNARTEERVVALLTPLLESAGYGPEIINVDHIPYLEPGDAEEYRQNADYDPYSVVELKLGYDMEVHDRLMVVTRVAVPADPDHAYFDPARIEASVFKIAFDDGEAYAPHPYPHLPPPDDTEETQGEALQRAQERVADAVVAHLAPPGTSAAKTRFTNDDQKSGFWCVNFWGPFGCGANNDDSRYMKSEWRFAMPQPDTPDSGVFVVGILHDVVGQKSDAAPKITYSTVMLKNEAVGLGVLAVVDRELESNGGQLSYDYWFPDDEAQLSADHAESIYVHRFARDCGGQKFCTEFGREFPGVGRYHTFRFVERAYLNDTSCTAPHESSVWQPIAVAVGTLMERNNATKLIVLD